MTTHTPSARWPEVWLSGDRFETFTRKCGGDRSRALAMYEWNARLSAAFLHDLAHLEVALRNAYDRQLRRATTPGDRHWSEPRTLLVLFPPAPTTGPTHSDRNATARQLATRARQSVTGPAGHFLPGKVVAEIMFGFWTFMTAGSHEDLVWTPYLRHAFPPGTDRNRLHETLSALRDFRNRVAHHEPILGAPESQRRRIVFVAKLLSPDVAAHIVEHSDVPDLLRRKP